MPIEKREKPVIKGIDAKKFLTNEKNVDENIKKYVKGKKDKISIKERETT